MYGTKKSKWAGVKGSCSIDADALGEKARFAVAPYRSVDHDGQRFDEVQIHFTSSGYYDPGKYSGWPENCYPEEQSDERLLESAEITASLGNDVNEQPLPAEVVLVISNDPVVEKAIADAEIDTGDYPDPPDDESRWG